MRKHVYIKKEVFRFRRFCRRAYAVFCSMHREVTIGRVASYIADRQLRKSACTVALCMPLLLTDAAMAQSDDETEGLTLPVVTITAASDTATSSHEASAVVSREVIKNLTATTVGELIEALPGVDIRRRGVGDVHGDISIRGGTFDQVVVLLNGIPVGDPQTGHYNLDLPIDLSMVERVELLSAAALMRYGVSAFCGGINIVTGQSRADRVRLSLSAGSHGTANAVAAAEKQTGRWHLGAAAAYNRSDGYRANTDYKNGSVMLQAQRRDEEGTWQMQMGAQAKNYGSQAFYSIKYPYQYDATRTLTTAVQRQQRIGAWQGEAAIYSRLHSDRFELFRTGYAVAPEWYTSHNYHLSSSSGVRLRAARQWFMGRSTLGAEYRREGIVSNVLGDSLAQPLHVPFEDGEPRYTLGKVRHRGALFADHSVVLSQWQISASLLMHANSMSGWNVGYALSARWQPSSVFYMTGSVSRSDRQPTFTDLYYHSATQVSNPSLRSEVSRGADLSAHYDKGAWHGTTMFYARSGTDIIDWIRLPSETVWHSVNHARIDGFGGEATLAYSKDGFLRRAEVMYSWCMLRQHADEYISQYALDYLHHNVVMRVAVSPLRHLIVKLSAVFRQREGHYTDIDGALHAYAPVVQIDAEVNYRLSSFELFVNGNNLLNRTYYDYGGIPMPRATFMCGIRYECGGK